jgi:TolB-like protein
MSGDPEQEYFADGIVEDIITAVCTENSIRVDDMTESPKLAE